MIPPAPGRLSTMNCWPKTSLSLAVKMRATWKELGLTGRQPVRDLWLQKDLGVMNGEFSAVVPAHGAILVKIGAPQTQRAQ